MTNDPIEIEDDDGRCFLRNYISQSFLDGRHRLIGDIEIKWNRVRWSPACSGIWYYMPIEELGQLIVQNCGPNNQRENDDTFREYAPLRPERELRAEDITPEQRKTLMNLNARLMQIEKDLLNESMPKIETLQKRVDDPDDWLEDFECECKLRFSLRTDDLDYDEEDSENVIIELKEYMKGHVRGEFGMADGVNHNEFERWEGHPMREEFHCWLYHCLYDHTHIGWVNMLRIGEVWIDIEFTLQRWECKLSEGV
jgi:hypothetical protein